MPDNTNSNSDQDKNVDKPLNDSGQEQNVPAESVPAFGDSPSVEPKLKENDIPVGDEQKVENIVSQETIKPEIKIETVVENKNEEVIQTPIKKPELKKEEQKIEPKTEGNNEDVVPPKNLGAGMLLKWFFLFGALLVIVFYAVLLWGLLGGNLDNPLFKIIGVLPMELKGTLLLLTNSIFGVVALFFLVSTLIRFFQWLVIEKNNENRRSYIVKSGIHFLVFIVVFAVWMSFFFLITNAQVDPGQGGLDNSIIITEPSSTIGLTTPITVEFDISGKLYSRIDRNLIRQINWDFDGDDVFDASGPSVIYKFLDKGKNNGKFPVTVAIEYYSPAVKENKILTVKKEVTIENESVVAMISSDKDSGPIPLEIDFSGENSRDPDGQIVLYEWDLDNDGSYEIKGDSQVVVTKTFSKVGDYSINLRVTGSNKDISVVTKKIYVGNAEQNLLAKISSDQGFEGIMPFKVTLDGNLSFSRFGDIVGYEWFIEGETEPVVGRRIKREFRKPGEYTIALTVTNENDESHRVERTIKVIDNQAGATVAINTVPKASASGIVRGRAPLEVSFDSALSTIKNPIEWRWDLNGDGNTDDFSQKLKHVYREPGDYMVRLTIVDSTDRTYEKLQVVKVSRSGTQAKMVASPIAGTVPLMVEFDGSGSTTDKGEIVSYIWEFPGEKPLNYGANATYEFKTVGNFKVNLKVLTSNGETDETDTLIAVRAHRLNAEFDMIINTIDPFKVSFDPSLSTGTILAYQWNFGDGNTSKKVSPNHTYKFPGKYKISLKVTGTKGVVSVYDEVLEIKK